MIEKNNMPKVSFRVDADDKQQVEELASSMCINPSEVFRKALKLVISDLKKNQVVA